MRSSRFLLAVGMAVLSMAARAQPVTGPYVGAGIGLNIMQNETDASLGGVATPNKGLVLSPGAAAVGSLGWGFGNGLRAELEFDYRYNHCPYPISTGILRICNPELRTCRQISS